VTVRSKDVPPSPAIARGAILGAALICFTSTPPAQNPVQQSNSPSPSATFLPSFDHDEKGLQNQYRKIAAFTSQPGQVHEAFGIFALPDLANWFGERFAKDQAAQLAKDYVSDFSTYEALLMQRFSAVPAGTVFRVRCKAPHPDPMIRMRPRRGAPEPLAPILVEQIVCEFNPEPKLKYGHFSIFANYVYVEGAFRYVGTGAYPFWSSPDPTHKGNLREENGPPKS
jgi:hypothetical protein